MNYRDVYDPAASYAVDDVVSHGGSSFIAKTVNTGVEPMVGTNWGLVAQKGEIGSAGTDGATGPAGPEGPRGPEGSPGASLNALDGGRSDLSGRYWKNIYRLWDNRRRHSALHP